MNSAQIARMLSDSEYVVCLSGREMIVEDGIDSMRDMETAYEIEMKYGYSPEEVFSAQFFNTRAEKFYEFYREEVLAQDKEPGRAYKALADMEEMGILKSTITRQLFNFPRRAGCKNVFNLHGNIYEKNCCPRCNKEYPVEYLKNSKKVPLCKTCGVPIHPGVTLLGEMVEIGLTTKAADEVSKADTLLLAGTNMRTEEVQQFMRYYQGNRVILIHDGEHYGDKEADYFVNARAVDILPEIVEELKKINE
ncbi:MAG: Sir2 family NAD-dependent protein deacetylase [Lachnospiraceae bacterium]|nr:Sir2 family NAD-dependent protein deacetylase [Lachnospiraceae bacterium]